MRTVARYGWVPDFPDHRDLKLGLVRAHAAATPPRIDLRPRCAPVFDQGRLGSCTANAIAAAFEYDMAKQSQHVFRPSRLFIYYNERKIEGSINEDAGAMIRDGMKSVAADGICPEYMWPYDESQFAVKPLLACYAEATKHQSLQYLSVSQAEVELEACLASGYPFVFGFTVYASFESDAVAQTGIVPMPKRSEPQVGGHAVMAVGYDKAKRQFIVRNSWGTGWGDKGYFYMPYDYVTSKGLADDFWTIRRVE